MPGGWRSGRTRSAPASSWTRRSSPVRGASTPSGGGRTRWGRGATRGGRALGAGGGGRGPRPPFAFDPLTPRRAADARRFELSTMSYASAIGLESSIAMLSSLGFERVGQHARRLATYLVDRVAELGWRPFRPPSDPSAAPHLVSLRHADHDPAVTAERLASRCRIVRGGRGGGGPVSPP